MNTASSIRNSPSVPASASQQWERHYDSYRDARGSYYEDNNGSSSTSPQQQAGKLQNPAANKAPLKYSNLTRKDLEEEEELRKYLHSNKSQKLGPPFPMLAYPSHWEIDRIVIPDCDDIFLSMPVLSKPAGAAGRQSSSSDQWMHDEKRAYAAAAGEASSSVPGCYSVTGPAHARSMQTEHAKYREPQPQAPLPSRQLQQHQHHEQHHHEQHQHRRNNNEEQQQQQRMEMEVSPGVYMALHGSEETRQAGRHGMLMACPCYNCDRQLHCIAIAISVLCPHCREISPIFFENNDYNNNSNSTGGGVGLGISESEYAAWEEEDYHQQRQQQQQQQQQSASRFASPRNGGGGGGDYDQHYYDRGGGNSSSRQHNHRDRRDDDYERYHS